jgi:hypothetical protein
MVSVTAGVYFSRSPSTVQLFGFVRACGQLEIIGMISLSIEFYLGLGYEKRDGHTLAVGEAIVTVEIEFLFFSVSVDLHYRKEIEGSAEENAPNRLNAAVRGHSPSHLAQPPLERFKQVAAEWANERSFFFDDNNSTYQYCE